MNYTLYLGVATDNSKLAAVGYMYADMPYTGIIEETMYTAVGKVGKSVIRNIIERVSKQQDMKTLFIIVPKLYMKTVSDLIWTIRMSMTTEVVCAEYASTSSVKECNRAAMAATLKLREGVEQCLYS